VAAWGLTTSAVSSPQQNGGAIDFSAGSSSGDQFQTNPEGSGTRPEPRSMLERLNDEDDDAMTDSSGDDNLEITCKESRK